MGIHGLLKNWLVLCPGDKKRQLNGYLEEIKKVVILVTVDYNLFPAGARFAFWDKFCAVNRIDGLLILIERPGLSALEL